MDVNRIRTGTIPGFAGEFLKPTPFTPYTTRFGGGVRDLDPIRFTLTASEARIRVGQPLMLTITAQYRALHPGLLATLPGFDAFRLRVIFPEGFESTGGTYVDGVQGQLSPSHPIVTYTIAGRFSRHVPDATFRLLRGSDRTDGNSLYIEKSRLTLRFQASAEPDSRAARIAAVSNGEGHIDNAGCSGVNGWAADRNNLNTSIPVDFYIDGTYAGSTTASNYRNDIAGYLGDNGNHGFSWSVPAGFQTGGNHTVEARFGGTSQGLNSGPKTYTCATVSACNFAVSATLNTATPSCGAGVSLNAPCTGTDCGSVSYTWNNGQNGQQINITAPASNTSVTYSVTASKAGCTAKTAQTTLTVSGCGSSGNSPLLNGEGHIDNAGCSTISGWAADRGRPNTAVSVDFYIDGTLAGTVPANQYRNDLAVALGDNGNHGFNWSVPTGFQAGGSHVVEARFSGSTQGLNSGPKTYSCASVSGCNFSVSATASTATPACGAGFTLNAPCTGPDCSGINYSWNTSQSGQQVSQTAPTTNSSVTYTVTATRTGCSAKTAQTIITVNGCPSPVQVISGEGHIDNASCSTVNGWAADRARLNTSIPVDFYIDGAFAGSTTAGQYRGDIAGYLGDNGNHGFSWPVPAGFQTGGNHTVEARYGSTSQGLNSGPRTFACTGTSTNCNFAVSATASTGTPACGAGVTLNAPCTGTDCGSVSYSWNTGQNSQQITTTAPASNTSVTYSVTASKAGCTSKTAQTTLTVSGCGSSAPINGEGHIDNAGCTSVNGWAADRARPNTLISVDFYIDGTLAGTVPANQYRHDLAVALGDNGNHGFSWPVPAGFQTGGTHVVEARFSGTSQGLNSGAKTYSCASISGCNFNVSATANTASASCGAAITLNAPCTGNDCGNVAYSWNTGQSGQQVTTTAQNANGTVTYSVSAAKSGCTVKTAQVGVTINGCNSTSSYQPMGRAGTRRDQFFISKSSPENGTISITDISNYSGPGGEYRALYFVNDTYVGQALNGYKLPVNGKFVIDKLISKAPVSTVNGYQRVENLTQHDDQIPNLILSWHQEIIDTQDPRTAIPGEQPIGNGVLLPLQPEWLLKTNTWCAQAVKDAPLPAIPTPMGKYYGGLVQEGKNFSLEEHRQKGWNVFNLSSAADHERQEIPGISGYNNALAQIGESFNPSSFDQGRRVAEHLGSRFARLQIDQMEEGHLPYESPAYIGMYERLREINEGDNRNVLLFGGYGQANVRYGIIRNFSPAEGGQRDPMNFSNFVQRYQNQAEARNRFNGTPDRFYENRFAGKSFHSIGMQQLIQFYPQTVNEVDVPYVKLHEVDIMLKQDPGRRPIGFLWPWREYAGGPAGGQNSYQWEHITTNPQGILTKIGHSSCGLIAPEIFAFDMMVRGIGLVFWNNYSFWTDDPNAITGNDIISWNPTIPGTPFNYISEASPRKPATPLIGYDAAHVGKDKALKALQFLGTSEPEWKYIRYSEDNGNSWREAPEHAILLNAKDYKPMVMQLRNSANGRRVIWTFDPYCPPNITKQLKVDLGDKMLDVPLKGNFLHLILIN